MSQPDRGARPVPQRAFADVAPTGARRSQGPGGHHPHGRPRRPLAERTFSGSVGWTLLSALVPGLGLVKTRWRRLGLALTAVAVALLVVVGGAALVARGALLSWITSPELLTALWVGLALFGVGWVFTVVATHLLTRPSPASGVQRVAGSLLVGLISLGIAVPTFVGARSIHDTASLITAVFQDGTEPGAVPAPTFGNASDPWAHTARLNVLILGGDAGADRVGTRTDTVILASVNTRSGDTVLYSLPRQTLHMPFPEDSPLHDVWPNGFYLSGQEEGASMLNAMYAAVPVLAPDAIPASEDPGAKVLQLSVGEALGLQVDYYAMVNLDGFIELVNALGGITVNINKPVPVGGKNPTYLGGSDGFPPDRWLTPGPNQHLNGYDALWFARGRYQSTDYERMSRQRCVIQAISRQVNPATVLANYEALTKAGQNIVRTDVPNSLLPALLQLSGTVRSAPLRSISFENAKDGFSTSRPDWDVVRERVQESLDSAPSPTAAPAPTDGPTPTTSPTAAPEPAPTASGPVVTEAPDGTRSVADECAYDPTLWDPTGPD